MIRIGVVGAGHLGKIHIGLLKELVEEYELVGFYDHTPANAQAVEQEYGIKKYASIQELIDQVDCIDVVTPTVSHFSCAWQAITQGRHVFIEKPISETLQEAQSLLDLKAQYPVKIQIGHVERFNPAFVAAQPYFDQPKFIESHRLSQFNPRGTDVPVVLDLMIHDIDIILSIVHSPVKHISASGVAVVSDTPDIANARIAFQNGCVANLTASRISMKNMRKSRFFQKDAYISVDFLTKELDVLRLETLHTPPDPFDLVFDMGNGKPVKKIYFDRPDLQEINAIKEELRTFAEAIRDDTQPIVSVADGYKALEVAHQILDNMRLSIQEML